MHTTAISSFFVSVFLGIVTITFTIYDMATSTLTYTIEAEKGTSIELPREFIKTVCLGE
jgi:hypothetical protein